MNKIQATMVALAFCFGVGCGEVDDPEVEGPEVTTTAALGSVDTGDTQLGSDGLPVAKPKGGTKTQQQCDDNYRDCVYYTCGLAPTPKNQACGLKCDAIWLNCLKTARK